MKRSTAILAAAFLSVTLAACGGQNNDVSEAELEDTEAYAETEKTDDMEDSEFEDEEDEEKVTVPDRVTQISACAFYVCINLEDVTVQSSISAEQIEMAFDEESPWYKKNIAE